MIKPFDITPFASVKSSPELSLETIKGIIIATFSEYSRNVRDFTHYTEVGSIKTGNIIIVTFTVTDTDKREDSNYFHWLDTESTYKLIDYINEMCEWAANYEFPEVEIPEGWEQKYNNKD